MAELINREPIVKRVKTFAEYEWNGSRKQAYMEFLDMLTDAPTVTEAEIRAKAISDIFEIMDNAVAHSSDHDERNMAYWVGFLKYEIEWATEQLKGCE